MVADRVVLALAVLLAASLAHADDESAGVEPPRLACAARVTASDRRIALDGHAARVRVALARAARGQVDVALPEFGWLGAGEPYPDRQYPELALRVNGAPAGVRDTFTAHTPAGDITPLLRDAGIDAYAIADTPPVVDLAHAPARTRSALMAAGALRVDADAGDLAAWFVRRQLRVTLPAAPRAILELRYRARPAFALRPAADAGLDATLQAHCTSIARLRALAPDVLANESVIVEESVFDVAASAGERDAPVALSLRAGRDAPPTVYAACGAGAASRIGVGSLEATGVVGRDGLVHVVALVAPALPARRSSAAVPAPACPDTLATDQSVPTLPDGFRASPGEGLVSRLSLVSFTEGDDEPGADVQPRQAQADGRLVRTWQFTAPRVRLHCAYAATRLVLTRDMPRGVSRCEATLDPQVRVAGEPRLLQLECR